MADTTPLPNDCFAFTLTTSPTHIHWQSKASYWQIFSLNARKRLSSIEPVRDWYILAWVSVWKFELFCPFAFYWEKEYSEHSIYTTSIVILSPKFCENTCMFIKWQYSPFQYFVHSHFLAPSYYLIAFEVLPLNPLVYTIWTIPLVFLLSRNLPY